MDGPTHSSRGGDDEARLADRAQRRELITFVTVVALAALAIVVVAVMRSTWTAERWAAISAVGSLVQAVAVCIGIPLAVRQIRMQVTLSREQHELQLYDNLRLQVLGTIDPCVNRTVRAIEELTQLILDAEDEEERRDPAKPVSASARVMETRYSLLVPQLDSLVESLAAGAQEMYHVAMSTHLRVHRASLEGYLSRCANLTAPMAVLNLCNAHHADQLAAEAEHLSAAWLEVRAQVLESAR